ncbi:truncated hemoglobin [Frankia sp. AgB32]|uniref:truncated hemoglobin n=1 Tax=Frankia sp. AgB32 TaxID=631119 RepID=UPI00200D2DE4|nr:hypothetical protein [Frankia sp. AgB32]MCK9894959.1 hypothetical protein [Frankia sp. AgB32]
MTTLDEPLGRESSIVAVAADFYDRVLADPLLAPYFTGVDLASLKAHQAAFLVRATGDPKSCTGPKSCTSGEPAAAHAGVPHRLTFVPIREERPENWCEDRTSAGHPPGRPGAGAVRRAAATRAGTANQHGDQAGSQEGDRGGPTGRCSATIVECRRWRGSESAGGRSWPGCSAGVPGCGSSR